MRRARLGVIVMVMVVLLLGACGGADTGNPSTPPELTLGEVEQEQPFYEGEYLGRTLTVVAEVRGSRSLELSGAGLNRRLEVLTRQPVSAAKGQTVRVTGTVGQLHVVSPSDRVPYLQEEDLYSQAETQPYLYAASVETLPG
jgi:hypothetical protein